jgi:hypothetical protein
MKNSWIKIYDKNIGHTEMFENFQEVLSDFGIDIYEDEDLAKKHDADMYVVITGKSR